MLLAIFTSLETMPLTMSTKHRRRSCWAGRRRARGRPGLSTAHAASAVAVLVDAHAFGGRGHAGLGVCRGRASPASPASRPLLEVKRGKTNVCPLDAANAAAPPKRPPHAVWEGSVVATRMRAGAPDDGARAPRPMFTGHAAAIVGVCLRGGQPNIFQTIIARHASAAWGPRRPPHRCG